MRGGLIQHSVAHVPQNQKCQISCASGSVNSAAVLLSVVLERGIALTAGQIDAKQHRAGINGMEQNDRLAALICQVCGKEYVVTSARCKYCPDCATDAVRAVDREQSKAWNHANIDYAKQRAQRHAAAAKIPCAICGKLFVPGAGGPVTCSVECNRVYRQQMSAKYHIAHRDEINARHRKNKGDLNND